ncbi:MAG TPA: TIM barrel protein [Vicinamibacterales bacterium]|nr:TIM barrel protein [Vicinamibacterales bacterium]
MIRVGNAPCSWGVLEFDVPPINAPAAQVLDEMAAAGYVGTELGDWGFLPTDPRALANAVGRRGLALAGAFVPVALACADALPDGTARAVRTARLLADAGFDQAFVVLSDANATVPHRTARAGRITASDGLSAHEWDGFAARASAIASSVRDETGLRTVFHHHCGGYVETPREIDALMARTDPALLGLCLDTGHLVFAGGDPRVEIGRYAARIRHVHFKDCARDVAARARSEEWDYHTAVRHGIFCELGRGMVRFADVRDALRLQNFRGWIIVEQDVLPGLGAPAASAARNRDYLRRLGL